MSSITASSLGAVTGVGSTVTSTSVTLTWTAPSGVPATGYTVTRTAPTTAAVCANVAVTTCTDSLLSGSTQYTYSIVALRGLWAGPAATHSATTSTGVVTRTFVVSVTGAATAGAAKSVSLTAQNNGVTDPTYTGSHTLTFAGAANGPNGNTPTTSQAVTFSAGVGTASLTFYKAETFTLTVSEASPARSGSTSVTVNAAPAQLSFSNCPTGPTRNTSFTTTVTRTGLDPFGNSTGTAAVSTVTLAPYAASPASNNNFTAQTVSFGAGALATGNATFETPNGNATTTTLTATATGYATASCTLTTT